MANKIDLDTIAKEYAEGRISKEDFLYLHKMLTDAASKKKPAAPQPPVLKTAHSAKAPTQAQQSRQQRPAQQRVAAQRVPPSQAQASQQRRSIRPQAQPQPAQHIPELPDFGHPTPDFLVEKRKPSVFGYVRRHHKEAVALLGTLGIFISMFYNNFNSHPVETGNGRVMMIHSERGKESAPQGLRTQDIKLIAELMMEDNSWNKELVDDFLGQWNRLSDNEKQRIKQSDWFNDFSGMLSKQIRITQSKAKTGDVSAIYDQHALLALADALIFGDSKVAKDALRKYASSDQDTVPETSDKKDADVPQSNSKDKPDSQSVQTAKLNDAPATTNSNSSEDKSARNKDTDDSDRNLRRISRQEIEDVMNKFTVAFEAGHTKDLLALFPDDEYSNSYTDLEKIKKTYKDLFRRSGDRRLDLSSFFWEHDFDEARGSAKYKTEVRDIKVGSYETTTANLDITLRRLMGKVYITNFKLKDQHVVAHASRSTNSKPVVHKQPQTASIKIKEKPKHPTPSELQDLVTQYITAYETGDVSELMHLFANATWTSSRTGLVEMKQNYQNLFTTTDGREMFVKDMNWSFKDKKAMGTGELTLTYHTKDDKIISQKGKIRVVATRNGDQVRFTQMFHIVE